MPRLHCWKVVVVVAAVCVAFGALALTRRTEVSGSPHADAATLTREDAQSRLRRLPLAFVENQGQWDCPARYVARFGAISVFLEERGWTLSLEQPLEAPSSRESREAGMREGMRERMRQGHHPGQHGAARHTVVRGAGLRMRFAGADAAEIVPEERLSGHHSYFLGNDPARWRTEVPLHGAVRYRGLYPGVDLRCYEKHGRFEYDVALAPGADLARVEVVVEGASELRLETDGAREAWWRWDGSNWSALGSGISATSSYVPYPYVYALATFNDGNGPALYAGGNFEISPAGDSFLAKWGCPAIATVPGCAGNRPTLTALETRAPLGSSLPLRITDSAAQNGIGAVLFGAPGFGANGCGLVLPRFGELLLGLAPPPGLAVAAPLVSGTCSLAVLVPNQSFLKGSRQHPPGVAADAALPNLLELTNALAVKFGP